MRWTEDRDLIIEVREFCFKGQAWFNSRRITYEQVNMDKNHKMFRIPCEGLLTVSQNKEWTEFDYYLFQKASARDYTVKRLHTDLEILQARIKYEEKT